MMNMARCSCGKTMRVTANLATGAIRVFCDHCDTGCIRAACSHCSATHEHAR